MKEFLPLERCFEEMLNQNEIDMIEDTELRELRQEYWKKKHQAFLKEADIPDNKLEDVFKKLNKEEKQKLAEYKEKHNIKL